MEKRRKKAGKLFAKECSAPDVAPARVLALRAR